MLKTTMVLIMILHGYKDAPYTEKYIGKVPNCLNETLAKKVIRLFYYFQI